MLFIILHIVLLWNEAKDLNILPEKNMNFPRFFNSNSMNLFENNCCFESVSLK